MASGFDSTIVGNAVSNIENAKSRLQTVQQNISSYISSMNSIVSEMGNGKYMNGDFSNYTSNLDNISKSLENKISEYNKITSDATNGSDLSLNFSDLIANASYFTNGGVVYVNAKDATSGENGLKRIAEYFSNNIVDVYNTKDKTYLHLTKEQLNDASYMKQLASSSDYALLFGESYDDASGFVSLKEFYNSIDIDESQLDSIEQNSSDKKNGRDSGGFAGKKRDNVILSDSKLGRSAGGSKSLSGTLNESLTSSTETDVKKMDSSISSTETTTKKNSPTGYKTSTSTLSGGSSKIYGINSRSETLADTFNVLGSTSAKGTLSETINTQKDIVSINKDTNNSTQKIVNSMYERVQEINKLASNSNNTEVQKLVTNLYADINSFNGLLDSNVESNDASTSKKVKTLTNNVSSNIEKINALLSEESGTNATKMQTSTADISSSVSKINDIANNVIREAEYKAAGDEILSAANETGSTGAGWCLAWVQDVLAKTDYATERLASAKVAYNTWCDITLTKGDYSNLKPGMIVAVPTSSSGSEAGKKYGHIGIYIGDGQIMHNTNRVETWSLDRWIDVYCQYTDGVAGAGWMGVTTSV